MKKLILCLYILSVCSCDHPENKIYERNQKVNTSLKDEVETNKRELLKIGVNNNEGENTLLMETKNGVRYVWIEINGIRLKFIFDTGASSISISTVEANILYRQGTLTKDDILDKEYFQDATGRISVGTKINLRTVKVGNRILQNIQATVINNPNAPLLLGQSVLENFGKIEIDYIKGEIIFK
jgi:aspartyl protease family protein